MQQTFAFQAAGRDGRIDRGVVDADSAAHAHVLLAGRGLLVLSIEGRDRRDARRAPISAADLALGLRLLADLLDAGLAVGRALVALEDLAPKAWRSALPHIRQSVREGRGLAGALASAPLAIPELVIGIAQAGETGAGIATAIRRAADLTESRAETQSAIRSALAYPILVAIAGVCAVGVLITVVLPRFAQILADLGQELPASTRFVIHAALAAQAATVPLLIVAICTGIAWHSWARTPRGRRRWHRMLLTLPVVGSIRRASASARIAHTLGALLDNGVPMAIALTSAAKSSGDGELEARIVAARASVTAGHALSQSLEASGALTPTVVRLARAGEETGRMPAMLTHAARIEQQRADRVVRSAVHMLEPVLLLTFASIVALVAAALLQAVYSVRPPG